MYFESFADFIDMGGHGFYVWLCYAIVLGSLIIQLVYAKGGVKRSKRWLKAYYRRLSLREETQVGEINSSLNEQNNYSIDRPSEVK